MNIVSAFSDYVRAEAEKKSVSPGDWLADTARNAGKCVFASHIGRFTNPEVTVNWQAKIKDKPEEGYVSTASASCSNDVFVAANYMATASLLQLKLEDDRTVYSHLLADDDYLKADITATGKDYGEIRSALLEIKNCEKPGSTDRRLRQVYFPVGEGDYHLLTVLPPSSLMQEVRRRIRDMEEEARQACDKKSEKYGNIHTRIYNLTQVKFGGTKPQNLSLNNNKQGGRSYMLPSLPPVLEERSIAYPRKDFFRDTLWAGNFRHLFLQLHACYKDSRHNLEARQRIRGVEHQIMDRVLYSVYKLRDGEAGWSASRGISKPQAIWLDDKYLKERQEDEAWQEEIAKDFSSWFMLTYERLMKQDKIMLGDGEFEALMTEIMRFVKDDLQKQ